MLNLEGIVARLQDRRVDVVHEATGLTKMTIINIKKGRQTNPKYETMEALSEYFESQEKVTDKG
tara:strand:+ start:627 stop:818 length:192 start_codon:yes stop_codon:yes gene_type:complete